MRKYLLKTSEGLAGRILETTEQTTGVICVALDLEVAGAAVAMSFRGEAPRYFGKSSREEILGAVKPLVALGNRVVCVQEVCGFGYCFHRELQAAGVESLVVAPEALNGRRKTDKRDAGKLCLLLIDYNPRFTLAHKPSEMACLLTLQRPLSVKRKISLIRVLLPGVVGDIVLTAVLLAGGDDPIHKVMDTFGISREPHLQRLVAL